MKLIACAIVLVASLTGCAVVPAPYGYGYGGPVVVGPAVQVAPVVVGPGYYGYRGGYGGGYGYGYGYGGGRGWGGRR